MQNTASFQSFSIREWSPQPAPLPLFVFHSVLELEASVAKLQNEVEQLKEQRNQQKQLADSSARQRDMYKALLTQSTGFSLPPPGTRLWPDCFICWCNWAVR